MLIIILVASVLLSIILYWSWRAWVGHAIGVHLADFEDRYVKSFRQSGSTEAALREALTAFQKCPKLNQIDKNDIERIVKATRHLKYPPRVVHELVMRLDSSTIVAALRNEKLLMEFAAVAARQEKAGDLGG